MRFQDMCGITNAFGALWGCGQKVGPRSGSYCGGLHVDGETVELLPYALEEGMGTEKASGLCGVRPHMAPTGLSGDCFAATRGHRASGTPGSRVGWARGRRGSAWQGWTGPEPLGMSQEDLEVEVAGCRHGTTRGGLSVSLKVRPDQMTDCKRRAVRK